MLKKRHLVLFLTLGLSACASGEPRIIQPDANSPEIRLRVGVATQIELPESMHAQSVVTGNPSLVAAERTANVVNLIPAAAGETNLIVRGREDDGDVKVYQYRLLVQER
ncbi:MAG: pilus assembly protein N-terminal domain-containing protein [Bdellovibrionales bacterium]